MRHACSSGVRGYHVFDSDDKYFVLVWAGRYQCTNTVLLECVCHMQVVQVALHG